MKIVYLHQYFLTPKQGGAIRSYHLAKALVDAGHDVELITAHNHLNYHYENIDGIKVHYLPVFYENNLSTFGRLLSFFKFSYKAYRKAIEIGKVDLCYATSTPLSIGLIALFLKRLHRIPYYFEVRDLWPEAPIQMGIVKSYFLKKYLYKVEGNIYKGARKIVALSPGIAEGVKMKVPHKEVYLLPNFSDCDFFMPENKNPEMESEFSVQGKFVISYFGALGKANHLKFLVDAAIELKNENIENVHFIIAGKGSEWTMIKELVCKNELSNISFIGHIGKDNLRDLLNVTDAVYISFANMPILETNSPNKFFDGIASGKLCITNIKGWIKELVEENQCGFYYNPEVKGCFLEKLNPYLLDDNLLKKSQMNARRLAEDKFSKKEICQKFIELF